MDYKTAKKLKEAGFPFREETFFNGVCLDCVEEVNIGHKCQKITPTLSELIKACGDDFKELVTVKNINGNIYVWQAYSYIDLVFGGGKTPEEAVAHLWLKLNN